MGEPLEHGPQPLLRAAFPLPGGAAVTSMGRGLADDIWLGASDGSVWLARDGDVYAVTPSATEGGVHGLPVTSVLAIPSIECVLTISLSGDVVAWTPDLPGHHYRPQQVLPPTTPSDDASLCALSSPPGGVVVSRGGGLCVARLSRPGVSPSVSKGERGGSTGAPEISTATRGLGAVALGGTVTAEVVGLWDEASLPPPTCAAEDTGTGRVLVGHGMGMSVVRDAGDGPWLARPRRVGTRPVTSIAARPQPRGESISNNNNSSNSLSAVMDHSVSLSAGSPYGHPGHHHWGDGSGSAVLPAASLQMPAGPVWATGHADGTVTLWSGKGKVLAHAAPNIDDGGGGGGNDTMQAGGGGVDPSESSGDAADPGASSSRARAVTSMQWPATDRVAMTTGSWLHIWDTVASIPLASLEPVGPGIIDAAQLSSPMAPPPPLPSLFTPRRRRFQVSSVLCLRRGELWAAGVDGTIAIWGVDWGQGAAGAGHSFVSPQGNTGGTRLDFDGPAASGSRTPGAAAGASQPLMMSPGTSDMAREMEMERERELMRLQREREIQSQRERESLRQREMERDRELQQRLRREREVQLERDRELLMHREREAQLRSEQERNRQLQQQLEMERQSQIERERQESLAREAREQMERERNEQQQQQQQQRQQRNHDNSNNDSPQRSPPQTAAEETRLEAERRRLLEWERLLATRESAVARHESKVRLAAAGADAALEAARDAMDACAKRDGETARRGENVRRREEALDGRDAQADRREAELAQRERELERVDAELTAREAEIDRLDKDVDRARADLARREEDIDRAESELARRESEIERAMDDLSRRRRRLDTRGSDHSHLSAELTRVTQERDTLADRLAEEVSRADALEARRVLAADLERAVDAHERAMSRLEAECARKEGINTGLTARVAELKEERTALELRLRETELSLRETLAARSDELEKKKTDQIHTSDEQSQTEEVSPSVDDGEKEEDTRSAVEALWESLERCGGATDEILALARDRRIASDSASNSRDVRDAKVQTDTPAAEGGIQDGNASVEAAGSVAFDTPTGSTRRPAGVLASMLGLHALKLEIDRRMGSAMGTDRSEAGTETDVAETVSPTAERNSDDVQVWMRISSQLEALREAVEAMRDTSSASLEMSQSVLLHHSRHDDSVNLTRDSEIARDKEKEKEKDTEKEKEVHRNHSFGAKQVDVVVEQEQDRQSRRRQRRLEGTVEILERENELLRTLCGELQAAVAAATGRRSSVSVDIRRSNSSPRSFATIGHETRPLAETRESSGGIELSIEPPVPPPPHGHTDGRIAGGGGVDHRTPGHHNGNAGAVITTAAGHHPTGTTAQHRSSPMPAATSSSLSSSSSASSSTSSLLRGEGERIGKNNNSNSNVNNNINNMNDPGEAGGESGEAMITRHGPQAFPKGISMQSFASSTDTDWLMDTASRGNTVFQFHGSARDPPQPATVGGGAGRLSSGGSAKGLLPRGLSNHHPGTQPDFDAMSQASSTVPVALAPHRNSTGSSAHGVTSSSAPAYTLAEVTRLRSTCASLRKELAAVMSVMEAREEAAQYRSDDATRGVVLSRDAETMTGGADGVSSSTRWCDNPDHEGQRERIVQLEASLAEAETRVEEHMRLQEHAEGLAKRGRERASSTDGIAAALAAENDRLVRRIQDLEKSIHPTVTRQPASTPPRRPAPGPPIALSIPISPDIQLPHDLITLNNHSDDNHTGSNDNDNNDDGSDKTEGENDGSGDVFALRETVALLRKRLEREAASLEGQRVHHRQRVEALGNALQSNHAKHRAHAAALRQCVQGLRKRLEESMFTCESYQRNCDKLQAVLAEREVEISRLRAEEIRPMAREITDLKFKIADALASAESARQIAAERETALHTLTRSHAASARAAETAAETAARDISTLHGQVARLATERDSLSRRVTSVSSRVSQLESALKSAEVRAAELESEARELRESRDALAREYEAAVEAGVHRLARDGNDGNDGVSDGANDGVHAGGGGASASVSSTLSSSPSSALSSDGMPSPGATGPASVSPAHHNPEHLAAMARVERDLHEAREDAAEARAETQRLRDQLVELRISAVTPPKPSPQLGERIAELESQNRKLSQSLSDAGKALSIAQAAKTEAQAALDKALEDNASHRNGEPPVITVDRAVGTDTGGTDPSGGFGADHHSDHHHQPHSSAHSPSALERITAAHRKQIEALEARITTLIAERAAWKFRCNAISRAARSEAERCALAAKQVQARIHALESETRTLRRAVSHNERRAEDLKWLLEDERRRSAEPPGDAADAADAADKNSLGSSPAVCLKSVKSEIERETGIALQALRSLEGLAENRRMSVPLDGDDDDDGETEKP